MSLLTLMRSKSAIKVAAVSGCTSLVVAAIAMGASATAAQASADGLMARQMNPQTLGTAGAASGTSSDKLKVTVGKSVIVTTNAAGKESLKVLVSNTQVSGNGKATVKVPIGTAKPTNTGSFGPLQTEGDSIVYNIDNSGGSVETLAASGGMYKGQLPINIQVKAWVDGKEVDPTTMTNVSGNVKIDYIFTNLTAKPTPLTYKNASGGTTTTTESIPVPFGASFMSVYPPGWADINAPWSNSGFTPSGEELTGTAILFPPLGGNTATLSLTARAENARLPGATITAVPIDLGAMANGLLLTAPDKIANIADFASAGAYSGEIKALQAQAMLLKYAEIVQQINETKVQPLVRKVDSLHFKGKILNELITLLEAAADAVALYFDLNQVIANVTSKFAALTAKGIDKLVPEVGKIPAEIETLKAEILAGGAQISTLFADITSAPDSLQAILNKVIVDKTIGGKEYKLTVGDIVQTLDDTCLYSQATNAAYGPGGSAAMTAGANTLSSSALKGNPKGALNTLNTALGVQSTGANGANAACQGLGKLASVLKTAYTDWLPGLENAYNNFATNTDIINRLNNLEAAANAYAQNLPVLANKLDNNNCQKTAAGIRQCGASQQAAYLAQANAAVAKTFTKTLVPLIDKQRGKIPFIDQLLTLAQSAVDIAGGLVNAVPGLLNGFAAKLGNATGLIGALGAKGAKLGDGLGLLGASINKMNDREQAGEGVPYGNASGGDAINMAAWQYAIQPASRQPETDYVNFGLALLLLLVGAGVGTALWIHRKPTGITRK